MTLITPSVILGSWPGAPEPHLSGSRNFAATGPKITPMSKAGTVFSCQRESQGSAGKRDAYMLHQDTTHS